MRKVKVTLPATVTNLGPGINSLGLSIALHSIVDITERKDQLLVVEPTGEGAGQYSVGLRHPVALGLLRVFQRLERSAVGLTVRIENRIPLASGLGAEAAFWVAGIIGANNLMGNPFSREQVIHMAAEVSGQTDRAVTTILGGLTATTRRDEKVIYRSLPVSALRVVVALPELDSYARDIEGVIPDRILLSDALDNLRQMPMLLDALREGDFGVIGQVMDDRLYTPFFRPFIRGYEQVVEAARQNGASGVTLSGTGPALVIFAESNHRKLADAVQAAFKTSGVTARVWILPIDTQGVVVSLAQSS
jgi:homoserine kinase